MFFILNVVCVLWLHCVVWKNDLIVRMLNVRSQNIHELCIYNWRGIDSLKPNLIIHKLKCSEAVVDVQWKYDLLSLSLLYNCRILSKTKRVWMRLCSFIYTYLLRNVRIFFLTLISDVRSIMNFSWNVQLINVCPSKTLSFNNIFIFILHNKWVWMKEHNLIHSSYCHRISSQIIW